MAKTTSRKKAAVEVLPAEAQALTIATPNELTLITDAGKTILGFVSRVRLFFGEAAQLEERSKATLVQARALVTPTNAQEDEEIQRCIKTWRADLNDAGEFWGITQVFHSLHKLTVSWRTRATQPLERSVELAQGLHNNYAAEAKRRADLEQDRLRREAEEDARRRQAEEAAVEEQKALTAERELEGLSDRERLYVDAIVANPDPLNAARKAGYKDPATIGPQLLERPKITAAIASALEAKRAREQAAAILEAPAQVREFAEVKPDITYGPGGGDTSRWTAEIYDEEKFIAAVVSGEYGIPVSVLTYKQAECSQLARALKENLNRVPGIRAKKGTTTR